MAMTMREIAAVALDEWLNLIDVEDDNLLGGINTIKQAQSNLTRGHTNSAEKFQMFDLAKHDRDVHDGHYMPGTRCKYRDKMLKEAKRVGLNARQVGLEDYVGFGNVKDKDFGLEEKRYKAELDDLNASYQKLKSINPNAKPYDYGKAVEDYNNKRDAYLKKALSLDEINAVNKLCNIAHFDKRGEMMDKFLAFMQGKKLTPMQELAKQKIADAKAKADAERKNYEAKVGDSRNRHADEWDDIVEMCKKEKIGSQKGSEEEGYYQKINDDTWQELDINSGELVGDMLATEEMMARAFDRKDGINKQQSQHQKTRQELQDEVESASHEYENAVRNRKEPDEIKKAQEKLKIAKEALNNREEHPTPEDLLEDVDYARTSLRNAQIRLESLKQNNPQTGEPIGRKDEIADAEENVANAENDLRMAEENFHNFEYSYDKPNSTPQVQSQPQSINVNGVEEYEIDGKKYVDVSGMGFMKAFMESAKAGWGGKDVITNWDKMSGRWDKIKSTLPKFQTEMDNLKSATALTKGKNETVKMCEQMLRMSGIPIEKKMAYQAALEGLRSGKDVQKVVNELVTTLAKITKETDAHKSAEGKEHRATEKAITDEQHKVFKEKMVAKKEAIKNGNVNYSGLTPDEKETARVNRDILINKVSTGNQKLKNDAIKNGDIDYPGLSKAEIKAAQNNRDVMRDKRIMSKLKLGIKPNEPITEDEEKYRVVQEQLVSNKLKKDRLAFCKCGLIPKDADAMETELAKQYKDKLDMSIEKAHISLEKMKGTQMQKTYAEADPNIIETMEQTAKEMDDTGDSVMKAGASQIRNTIINTLKKTHDGSDAYNAVHKFKKLLGVNDDSGKKGEGSAPTINVSGVDHKNGGTMNGNVNAQNAVIDTTCLDRTQPLSNGEVHKQQNAINKIKSDFQTIAQMQVQDKDIDIKPGISSTTMTIGLNGQRVNKQALLDAISTGMGNVVGTKDDNGNNKSPVSVTYDKNTDSVKISLPNDKKGVATFAHIIDNPNYRAYVNKNKGKGSFALGVKEDGSPDMHTLDDMIHLLIAGQTGAGKSVKEHTIINSLFEGNSPDDLRMILVDPKGTELVKYKGDKHLISDPVVNMDDAAAHLNWLVDENENRAKLFSAAGVRTLNDYNELGKQGKLPAGLPQHLPRIAMMIDELADLTTTHGKEVEGALSRLSAKARSQGIHLIAATQRPDSKVITGTVKSNFPSTMGMSTKNRVSSDVIGIPGLENMAQKGPYALMDANGSLSYGEGTFMSDNEIDGMVKAFDKAYNNPPPPSQPQQAQPQQPVQPVQPQAPTASQQPTLKLPDNIPNTPAAKRLVDMFNNAKGANKDSLQKSALAMLNRMMVGKTQIPQNTQHQSDQQSK